MIPPAHIRRLALVLLVLLGACADDDPTAPPLAAAVAITPGPQTFAALGITQQFTAVARDANGTSLCRALVREARPVHVPLETTAPKWGPTFGAIFEVSPTLTRRLECLRRDAAAR